MYTKNVQLERWRRRATQHEKLIFAYILCKTERACAEKQKKRKPFELKEYPGSRYGIRNLELFYALVRYIENEAMFKPLWFGTMDKFCPKVAF